MSYPIQIAWTELVLVNATIPHTIVHTPKHGSWLNIAEIELSVLTRQCLCRHIPDIETLRRETKAWETRRNSEAKQVDWHFTTDDARIRLKHLYPQF